MEDGGRGSARRSHQMIFSQSLKKKTKLFFAPFASLRATNVFQKGKKNTPPGLKPMAGVLMN
jgi:hypothetical protein